MTRRFKVGDRVKLSGANVNMVNESFLYSPTIKLAKIGKITEMLDTHARVIWQRVDGSIIRAYFYSFADLIPASVIYSEDHLKEKDVL